MRVYHNPLRVMLSVLALVATLGLPQVCRAQKLDGQLRDRGRRMLKQARKDIEKYYYDETYHGVDLDASYARADSAITLATNTGQLLGAIAQFVADLNDSHTEFHPPPHANHVRYGYGLQFFGDTCYVISVTKGSDAEKKGVKVGDALLKVDRFTVERKSFNTLTYVYYTLAPRASLKLTLKSPGEVVRVAEINAEIIKGRRVIDYTDLSSNATLLAELEDQMRMPEQYYRALGDSVLYWYMPSFVASEDGINEMMDRAEKFRAVVLDLRGNGGGLVSTEMFLISHLTDHDLKIMTTRSRNGQEDRTVKPYRDGPYRGRLIVLIDSYSASASEITARILQLESRAKIVGDRSMGAVETSVEFDHEVGAFGQKVRAFNYSIQVTVADVIMPDGNRLEGIGVTPDYLVIPSGADLAAKRDPALSQALDLAGYHLSPEEAGRQFKLPWEN
jgi:carboxyl-terminal processing protease